jgi:small-conductance mechanosensitive channel/CRP-like cAMP-binding protein
MGVLSGIIAELQDEKTAGTLLAALALLVLTRLLAGESRDRVHGALVLLGLHLLLVPVAGTLRVSGSTFYRETRLAAQIFETLAFINLGATLLFAVALRRVHVYVPRILQDVLVAGSAFIAIFALASRAGVSLSGLIATSTVLTAVIGLSFQDTLGNILGGLAIQIDDSVRLGDWIRVGDVYGCVTEIRWRYTAVVTRGSETVIFPNSLLAKSQVTVLGRVTGKPIQWRRTVEFNVDFRYSPSEVIRLITEVLTTDSIDNVSTDPPPSCVVADLADSFAKYSARFYVIDLGQETSTASVIRTRIFYALRRGGIALSVPAQSVFLTQDTSERRQEKSHMELDRKVAALRNIQLFRMLSTAEYQHLAEHMRYTPFAANEVMTHQGAEAHWLYIIIQGEASVRIAEEGGETRELAKLHPGDFFGEMSLLTGQRRSATVVALAPTDCYRLDKPAFQELLERRPEVAGQLADILTHRREELLVAKDNLSHEAAAERRRATRKDLLDQIRGFFGLDDDEEAA